MASCWSFTISTSTHLSLSSTSSHRFRKTKHSGTTLSLEFWRAALDGCWSSLCCKLRSTSTTSTNKFYNRSRSSAYIKTVKTRLTSHKWRRKQYKIRSSQTKAARQIKQHKTPTTGVAKFKAVAQANTIWELMAAAPTISVCLCLLLASINVML